MRCATSFAAALAATIAFSGCASTPLATTDRLRRDVAAADVGYKRLAPGRADEYNTALTAFVRDVDLATPALLRSELCEAGVKIDDPAVKLPLVRYHAVRTSLLPNESLAIGAPVVLEYDTKTAPIYPHEGMFLSATAIYRRVHNQPHLSFVARRNNITIRQSTYPLVRDNTAATAMLMRRSRRVAQSGLTNLLHPNIHREAEIVLTAPYDADKIPILLVHGLQSTPFTFLKLATALESNPEIAGRFQFWHSTSTFGACTNQLPIHPSSRSARSPHSQLFSRTPTQIRSAHAPSRSTSAALNP